MKKVIQAIDEKLEEYLLVAILAFMVTIIFIQVIMRYAFQNSLSWSEEITRYLFVWICWLGAGYAVKHDKHITITVFRDKLPERIRIFVEYIALIMWIGFSIFMCGNSWRLAHKILLQNQLAPATQIPMAYAYAAIPVGFLVMSLRLIQQLFKKVRAKGAN